MSGSLDHIAFLSQEVGPRPAGTEEEQQAALYITEQMQKEAGLSAVIEDFNSESNEELPGAICAAAALIFTVVAMIFPVMAIPAIIIAIAAALLYTMEMLGRSPLSKFFVRGVSQNVVAKYEPTYSQESGGTRRRKVILLANYDSGKVRFETNGALLGLLPLLKKLTLGAMIFLPLFLLIKNVFFLHAEEGTALFLNVITILVLLLVAIPVVLAVIHIVAPYNEAANCNASGVATLIEAAKRANQQSPSDFVDGTGSMGAVIHGEESAYAAGLVPEGAELTYQAAQLSAPEPMPQSEEERLVAAKMAIAAMTGKSVSPQTHSVADNLVQVKEKAIEAPSEEEAHELREETKEAFSSIPEETLQEAYENAVGSSDEAMPSDGEADQIDAVPQQTIQSDPSVPDWFRKAQENAKRPKKETVNVQRSRYADALDAAVAESTSYFNQANQKVSEETAERLKKMRDGIIEVSAPKAPSLSRPEEQESGDTFSEEVVSETQYTEELPVPGSYAEQADLGATISMPPLNVDELRSQEEAVGQPFAEEPSRSPIVLPDISATGSFAPIEATKQQRAPLAMTEESSQASAKSLLNMLPSIDIAAEGEETDVSTKSPASNRSSLKGALPSLSGELRAIKGENGTLEDALPAVGSPSATGSLGTVGATGTFAPVSNELLESVDPDDIYVEDADDSVYEEGFTETGAIAGPGYVEMPKSRVRNLFGRFKRDKKKDEVAPSAKEWLDVDDDFDARSVGAARGDWKSFQEDQPDYGNDYLTEDDKWEGGAYNADQQYDPSLSGGMEQIHQFRNGGIDTEVWFVALGSELANNGGMKAFLHEHEQDLRGAIFINLCGLGAGELSFVQAEGWRGKTTASSRMKRYLKKASQASGVDIDAGEMKWKQSAATVATDKGLQAMTIAGLDGNKPAFFAQGDDVLENIDEGILERNIDFVMELIKSI